MRNMKPLYVGCTKPSSHWSGATRAWLGTIGWLLLVGCHLRKVVSCKTGTTYLPHPVFPQVVYLFTAILFRKYPKMSMVKLYQV